MSMLTDILDYNREFVRTEAYREFATDRFPNRKLVILSCMDTRLVELLPRAMNVRNGDVKIIKNAGAVVSHPFGSVMRSILVAVYDLGAEQIMVVGHHGCGMTGMECGHILEKMKQRGIDEKMLQTLRHAGIELDKWLRGFQKVEDGVRESAEMIRNHPLLPQNIKVHGLIMSPETGNLEVVVNGD